MHMEYLSVYLDFLCFLWLELCRSPIWILRMLLELHLSITRAFQIDSYSSQIRNTGLLTMVTVLWITSLWFFNFITGSLCLIFFKTFVGSTWSLEQPCISAHSCMCSQPPPRPQAARCFSVQHRGAARLWREAMWPRRPQAAWVGSVPVGHVISTLRDEQTVACGLDFSGVFWWEWKANTRYNPDLR